MLRTFTCISAVVVGLIAALTPGLWAHPFQHQHTGTPPGVTDAPRSLSEVQPTAIPHRAMRGDTVSPRLRSDASPAAPADGGLIWFTDRADFLAFNLDDGKVLKGIEDYEESILDQGSFDVFDDSLESGAPNLPDGVPFPVGMTGLPSLIVQSNFEHNPGNPNPRGVNALLALSEDSPFGTVSDVVFTNRLVDSLDVIFTDAMSGTGFNTLLLGGGSSVEVRVYSTTNVFQGMMSSPADLTGANFIGVWSPTPVGRINIFDPDGGAEGADNIQAWTTTQCPGGLTDIVDLQAQTGNSIHLGIHYVASLDIYWSSARVEDGPHKLYSFDSAGVLTGEVVQFPGAQNSPWGYRDMASDGEFIYAGWETGVARHNLDGTDDNLFIAGGPPGGAGTWRGLAYDPTGDGGAGSLWVGDFASPLVETSMTGVLLNSFPNIDGWSLYGLAFDPNTGNLWGYSSPNQGNVVEIDIQDGSPTEGRQTGRAYFPGCIPGTGGPDGNCQIQGGLTMVPGGAFEFRGVNAFDLVLLGQATSDSIIGIRIEPCPADCPSDLDSSGAVDFGDILAILSAWGQVGGPEDLDGSGTVDFGDLLVVLAAWGPCP